MDVALMNREESKSKSKSKSIDKRDKMSTRTRFNLHRLLQRTGNYPHSFRNILYNDFYDGLVVLKE